MERQLYASSSRVSEGLDSLRPSRGKKPSEHVLLCGPQEPFGFYVSTFDASEMFQAKR